MWAQIAEVFVWKWLEILMDPTNLFNLDGFSNYMKSNYMNSTVLIIILWYVSD